MRMPGMIVIVSHRFLSYEVARHHQGTWRLGGKT
jgi:hypothetical protein